LFKHQGIASGWRRSRRSPVGGQASQMRGNPAERLEPAPLAFGIAGAKPGIGDGRRGAFGPQQGRFQPSPPVVAPGQGRVGKAHDVGDPRRVRPAVNPRHLVQGIGEDIRRVAGKQAAPFDDRYRFRLRHPRLPQSLKQGGHGSRIDRRQGQSDAFQGGRE
jgi:hypothetical protein